MGGCLMMFIGIPLVCGLFLWWLFALFIEIFNPIALGLRPILITDALCLSLLAYGLSCLTKKGKNYYVGFSVFFFVLIFFKPEWILALLNVFRINEEVAVIFLRWPSVILLTTVPIIVWLILPESKTKIMKRGVEIRPLKLLAGEEEIIVGAFAPKILPADIIEFACAEKGAKISLPGGLLTRGISILGDPGSGKSRLMRLIHDGIHRQFPNIPVLIHDPKGEWLRTYYDPATDLIFAPYDKRGVSWDILSDIKTNPQLLSSIVATAVSQHHGGGGESVYWTTSASAIIQEQLETSSDMISFRDGLLNWRESHGNDKTALSAYSSARPAIKDIATIALADGLGGKRTMEQFLNHRGRIFLLNSPTQNAEQSGAFAIFISAFALSCLSQCDTSTPRAVAIIDEALTFHLPPSVEQAITAQSRSKGLITIAASQWIPKDERRLLTRAEFIFGMKVGDIETGKQLSALSGHVVYDENVTTKNGDASTSSHQQERSRQMMPPEYFRSLPDRSFILLHQAGFAPGTTAEIQGEQRGHIAAFDYQQQPLISEYMKVL